MARRRRLNRRGKIAVGLLVALTAALFFFLGGNDKDEQRRPVKSASAGVVIEIPTVEKSDLYLTFDDGPSKESGRLLDLLNEFNMKATFFMLGPHMENDSDVVKRMKEEGFGLALHGTSHQTEDIYSGPLAPLHEMEDAQAILEEQTGVRSSLIRLPYGSVPYLTVEMRGNLAQKGFRIWDWDIDSRDWELKDERFIQHTIERIEHMIDAGESPVVLLHDRPELIDYLPELLRVIETKGYKTGVLTDEMQPVTFHCEGRCHSYVANEG